MIQISNENYVRAMKLMREAIELLNTRPAMTDPVAPAVGGVRTIAWGARVSQVFRNRVCWVADKLGTDASNLMTCMAFETDRTFRANIRNYAGSSGTGLIQFMETTAKAMGTTTKALAQMSAEDQLSYVYRYFKPMTGRIITLEACYLFIFYPKAATMGPKTKVFIKGSKAYEQNNGLDADNDGDIEREEITAKVTAMLPEGMLPGNVWTGAVETGA